MSQFFTNAGRTRFPVRLKCANCGTEGSGVWEENAELDSRGPMSSLEELSEGFYRRTGDRAPGVLQIICGACDTPLD